MCWLMIMVDDGEDKCVGGRVLCVLIVYQTKVHDFYVGYLESYQRYVQDLRAEMRMMKQSRGKKPSQKLLCYVN